MLCGVLQPTVTRAEDRAPVRTDPSADPGTKTEGRAVLPRHAPQPSLPPRDWHHRAKPSRQDAAKYPARCPYNALTTGGENSGSR